MREILIPDRELTLDIRTAIIIITTGKATANLTTINPTLGDEMTEEIKTGAPMCSTGEGSKHPNLLRYYREGIQTDHQETTGQAFHLGNIVARADIGSEYWMAIERGERSPSLNNQRGICIALKHFSPKLQAMDVEEIVHLIFVKPILDVKETLANPPVDDEPGDPVPNEPKVDEPPLAPAPATSPETVAPPAIEDGDDNDEEE